MQKSKLSEHIIKKGQVLSPMLASLGDILQSSSWGSERLPEYIWMALIHNYYGREQGNRKIKNILFHIIANYSHISSPTFSDIFIINKPFTEKLTKYIASTIDPNVLAPMTALIKQEECPVFYKYFFNPKYSLEDRLDLLTEILKNYSDSHSENATDIRFFPVAFQAKKGILAISRDDQIVIDTFNNYYSIPHSSELMRTYRPTFRSMEIMVEINDKTFISLFWRRIAGMSECKLMSIKFPENEESYTTFISDTKEAISYLNAKYIVDSAVDKKYSVIVGMTTFAFKTLIETVEHDLSKSVLGRFSVRTIIECYIMLKYLCANETAVADIWGKYQAYGIGKYKLVLLKAREKTIPESSHVSVGLLDVLVNEEILEEYTEIDLRYFDQKGIREKAIDVGEKDLYDIYYDYDSSYAHGLWGAVRESSMLHCSNPAHKYHSVPDGNYNQTLINVLPDCVTVFLKILMLINDIYPLPEWYIQKYLKG